MPNVRLPFEPLDVRTVPEVVDRANWTTACEDLRGREKANLRESDAIAAARRRLPMTPVPRDVQVVGPDGSVPLVDAFEGRRQLVGYFHRWHDGRPRNQQCEGTYSESRPYADFVQNRLPWW